MICTSYPIIPHHYIYKKLSIHKIRIEYESIFHNIVEGANPVYDNNGYISAIFYNNTCIFKVHHERKIILCFELTKHCDSLNIQKNDIREIVSYMFFKYYNLIDYYAF